MSKQKRIMIAAFAFGGVAAISALTLGCALKYIQGALKGIELTDEDDMPPTLSVRFIK